jgi:hypothetical protein
MADPVNREAGGNAGVVTQEEKDRALILSRAHATGSVALEDPRPWRNVARCHLHATAELARAEGRIRRQREALVASGDSTETRRLRLMTAVLDQDDKLARGESEETTDASTMADRVLRADPTRVVQQQACEETVVVDSVHVAPKFTPKPGDRVVLVSSPMSMDSDYIGRVGRIKDTDRFGDEAACWLFAPEDGDGEPWWLHRDAVFAPAPAKHAEDCNLHASHTGACRFVMWDHYHPDDCACRHCPEPGDRRPDSPAPAQVEVTTEARLNIATQAEQPPAVAEGKEASALSDSGAVFACAICDTAHSRELGPVVYDKAIFADHPSSAAFTVNRANLCNLMYWTALHAVASGVAAGEVTDDLMRMLSALKALEKESPTRFDLARASGAIKGYAARKETQVAELTQRAINAEVGQEDANGIIDELRAEVAELKRELESTRSERDKYQLEVGRVSTEITGRKSHLDEIAAALGALDERSTYIPGDVVGHAERLRRELEAEKAAHAELRKASDALVAAVEAAKKAQKAGAVPSRGVPYQTNDIIAALRTETGCDDPAKLERAAHRMFYMFNAHYEPTATSADTPQDPLPLRPAVAWFSQEMERKLRENDHKSSWLLETPVALLERVGEEFAELSWEVRENTKGGPLRILREAADVANMAMMVADVCCTLKRPEGWDQPVTAPDNPATSRQFCDYEDCDQEPLPDGVLCEDHKEPDNTAPVPLPEVLPIGTRAQCYGCGDIWFVFTAPGKLDKTAADEACYTAPYSGVQGFVSKAEGLFLATRIDWARWRSQQNQDSGSPGDAETPAPTGVSGAKAPGAAQPGDASLSTDRARLEAEGWCFEVPPESEAGQMHELMVKDSASDVLRKLKYDGRDESGASDGAVCSWGGTARVMGDSWSVLAWRRAKPVAPSPGQVIGKVVYRGKAEPRTVEPPESDAGLEAVRAEVAELERRMTRRQRQAQDHEGRLAALERDSHKPVDFTPVVAELRGRLDELELQGLVVRRALEHQGFALNYFARIEREEREREGKAAP